MNNNIEEWRLIDGYDNYQVSSVGRVRNTNTMKILKPMKHVSGYYLINLSNNNVRKNYQIHRLVCFAFCNNDNDYNVVDHIDRNRINNNYLNLRWVTDSMNSRNRTISNINSTGIQGVSFDTNYNRWKAQWHDNEGPKSKAFPVKKYGEQARQMAIDYRREMEILHGYNIL